VPATVLLVEILREPLAEAGLNAEYVVLAA
jgi:hypothetical protein